MEVSGDADYESAIRLWKFNAADFSSAVLDLLFWILKIRQ